MRSASGGTIAFAEPKKTAFPLIAGAKLTLRGTTLLEAVARSISMPGNGGGRRDFASWDARSPAHLGGRSLSSASLRAFQPVGALS